MGEMVVNYSLGKKNLAQHEAAHRAAIAEFQRARAVLLQLMVEDQAAYEAITAAKKLPPDAPDRQARFDAALLACIRVPQAPGGDGRGAAGGVRPYGRHLQPLAAVGLGGLRRSGDGRRPLGCQQRQGQRQRNHRPGRADVH